ncbi:hypothetical protein RFI_25846 [Reticulomyxa filosa]|uniref:Uncharacterized protein n=1 Tax=Reticulomyxa filosa TaxID=46433 RepID=X6MCY4_RETFI|nr:hypothetical protein RFI_25846 [Reticulomyxa filosa]|eukprot:ETO11526.1 hypothetical protein RFI_25846 [Reticulomyxa filosa]
MHTYIPNRKTNKKKSVVKIWVPKSSVEMTQIPNWRKEIAGQCDFFVQSDMHDIFDRYMRSTAVYHYPNTNAVTIQERHVRRYNWLGATLFMSSPIGGAVSFVIGLIASAAAYLRRQNLSESVSLFIVSFFVLVSVIILVGCLIEVELRKRVLFLFLFFFSSLMICYTSFFFF